MKFYHFCFFLLFASFQTFAQQTIGIPENWLSERFYENLDSLTNRYNLPDLRETEQSALRIWTNQEIINLGSDNQFLFFTRKKGDLILKTAKLEQVSVDSVIAEIDKNLDWFHENSKYHLDAFPNFIEIQTGKNYHVISFYKNQQLQKLISSLRNELDIHSIRQRLIEQLEPGNYQWGMSSLHIDHLVPGDADGFYKKILPEIMEKFGLSSETPTTKMPLVMINKKPAFLKDLNELEMGEVEKYELLQDATAIALYGFRASNGVILVKTR
ncbi:MAG: hypothetical protein VX712_01000 [Bacteroidota bacterium]|nr:hypothetical protein [Bacteroidota bacterium]